VASPVGFDSGDLKVTPLHGKAFYLDIKNGVNASYIGYSVKNESSAAIDDLWMSLTDFRSTGTSVLSLANPADSFQPIGTIGAGATKFIYALVKGNNVSVTAQLHEVQIHKGYPNGEASIYGAGAAQCTYTFSEVNRIIAASANKVTEVSVDTTAPKLGGTLTITVKGATGQAGSGSASVDGEIMWMSGASAATWPTRALRLERTQISIKYKKNDPIAQLETYNDQILITRVATSPTKFTSSTTYTATFTFRVMGGASTNPIIKPVANIASGTQIKHTGSYPSATTTVNLTGIASTVTSVKEVTSVGSLAGDFFPVGYKITLTDSEATSGKILDSIIDLPDSSTVFVANSAKIVDNTRTNVNGVQIANPVNTGTSSSVQNVFAGPFVFNSAGKIILTYTMNVPAISGTYDNKAYGLSGGTIVGTSGGQIYSCPINVTGTSTPATPTCTTVAPVKQDQVIDFPQFPALGIGSSYTLDATASSGLPVTYTSNSPTVCTVSGATITIISEGTCSITASQSGNDQWNPATVQTKTIRTLLGQRITFNPDPTMTTGGSQSKAATSDSNLPVTLTVITTDVCRVTNSTTPFTIEAKNSSGVNASGTCVIVASQAGDSTYGPAPDVERIISIGTPQAIDWSSKPSDQTSTSGSSTLEAFSRTPLSSSTTLTFLPILFTSRTPAVCTTGETGAVLTNGGNAGKSIASIAWTSAGICELVASQDGFDAEGVQSAYAPASDVVYSFRIGNNTPTVTISGSTTVTANTTNAYSVTVTAPAAYPSSGSLTLSGTVTLYASGWIISSSQIQSNSVNSSVTKLESVSTSFNITSSNLGPGAANELYELSATFTTSNASNFTSSATASATNVTVVAPVTPAGTTESVATYGVTTATLPGTLNSKTDGLATALMLIGTSESNLVENTSLISNEAYSNNSSSGDSSVNFSASASNLTAASLYFYQTKVTRSSLNGFGVVKKFVTKPGAPSSVTVTTNSSTLTGSVSFTGVSAGEGVTILYTVTCTGGTSPITATGSSSPIAITGLAGGVTYTCTVKATASATGALGGGDGDPSSGANGVTKKVRTISIKDSATDSSTVSVVYGDTVTATIAAITAGDNSAGDISASESDGSKTASVVSGGCSLSTLTVSRTSVGTCVIRGSQAEGTTFTAKDSSNDLTITWTQATIGVTPSSISVTYGDALPSISPVYNPGQFKRGENSASSEFTTGLSAPTCGLAPGSSYSSSTPAETVVNIICTGGSATNYQFTHSSGSFTVAKKSRTVTLTTPSASSTDYTDWSITAPTLVATASAGDNDGTKRYTTSSESSICTVNETTGVVTFVGPGNCVVTTSIDAGTNHNSAVAASSKTIVIGKKTQLLTFVDQNLNISAGTTVSLSASTNANVNTTSLGSYVYELDTSESNSSGCSVTSTTLTFTGAGTCYVKVSKGGNTHWTDATETATFVISAKKSRTLIIRPALSDSSTVTVLYGETVTARVNVDTADGVTTEETIAAAESEGSKSIDITDGEGCSVSGFDISHSSVGTCKVRGRISEGSNYEAKDSDSVLTVVFGKATINVTPAGVNVTYGESLPSLSPTYDPSHFKKSENANSSAFTTGLSAPTCAVAADSSYSSTTIAGTVVNIVCSGGSATNYQFTHSTSSFTVGKKNHIITFNELSPKTVGEADQDLPTSTNESQPIIYTVNDLSICEIVGDAPNFKVRAKAAGTCTVNASSPSSTNYNAATGTTSRGFTISAAAKLSRTLNINNSEFDGSGIWSLPNWGESAKTLTSLANEDDSDSKTYSTSSSATICEVTSAGVVTPKGAGDCVVQATITEGARYNSATSTTKIIRIGKKDHVINFPSLSSQLVGDADQSLPTTTDQSQSIEYSVNDPAVCEIVGTAPNFKVRGKAAGTCTVTASSPSTTNFNSATGQGGVLVRTFGISNRPVFVDPGTPPPPASLPPVPTPPPPAPVAPPAPPAPV